MFEVEAKLVLQAPGALRRRLEDLGAEPTPSMREIDTYYAVPGRDIVAAGGAFRVRRTVPVDGSETGAAWHLTYKGPAEHDAIAKRRVEHERAVDGDPHPLLAALGFTRSATIEKTRKTWRHEGLTVTIDEVAGLGRFAEVEVVSADADAAAEAVEAAVKALGLIGADRVQTSYLELALELGAAAAKRLS